MTIEPYRFSNGEAWGNAPEKTPGPAQIGKVSRGRAPSGLTLRAKRAKTDPNWASHSAETRRLLVDLDRKEGQW